MAAAYAALRSLKCTLDTIKNMTQFSFSINKKQLESLQEKVDFLIDFLENFTHRGNKKAQDLENRMVDAAHDAEDAIELQVENSVRIERLIDDLALIKSDAMEIKKMRTMNNWLSGSSVSSRLSSSTPIGKSRMVGFDGEFRSITDRLTGGKSSLLIIPIVGMGGIGKTTLAKSVYEHKSIVGQFDIRVWVTLSQHYDVKRILSEILNCNKKHQMDGQISEAQLVVEIHKNLFGRRYLVTLDDMWEIDAWERLQSCFPDNQNGSRIMVTTRSSDLATQFGSSVHRLNFLDVDKSWLLFCNEVFGEEAGTCKGRWEEDCQNLEEVGKKIATNCKGLPLSIVVIGGLLAMSVKTKEFWEYVANDLNSIANLGDNERCRRILALSYHNLPIHLKPCFLYIGVFREDKLIDSSKVIQLWIAEGFLKPITGKDLEVVGNEYLKDLFGRNLLIIYDGVWDDGKHFKIHDILRDLCLRECQSPNFLYVQGFQISCPVQDIKWPCRIIIHPKKSKEEYTQQVFRIIQSSPCLRSLRCHDQYSDYVFALGNPKLLRILDVDRKGRCSREDIVRLVNCRYISLHIKITSTNARFPSPENLMLRQMWNLQFLQIKGHLVTSKFVVPPEIWKMTQLRHVDVSGICLPKPPTESNFVLENLHTLSQVSNFRCTKEVVKRIPNIRKLVIKGKFEEYCFKNLGLLLKLETLDCTFSPVLMLSRTVFEAFPRSLKDLTLENFKFDWKDLEPISSLPCLEVLRLGSFKCPTVWEPIKKGFSHLKVLDISNCDIVEWNADDTHFPRLERLTFGSLSELEEIPIDFAYIATLKSIHLSFCSISSISSAKDILDSREDAGDVDLQVWVDCYQMTKKLHSSLASKNFVIYVDEFEDEEFAV